MSTTLLIGRWPEAISRAFSHAGDGPILTSSNSRAVKRGHRSGASTSMLTPSIGPGVAGIVEPRRRVQRRAGGGVDLARGAVDRQAVGPVGGDLELEHVGGDRQHVGQRRARQQLVVEHHDPVVVEADRDLVLGQDHALRRHAAELGALEPRAVGHHRAGLGDGHGLAGGDVGRAADDRGHVALADGDLADAQPVGVRVLLALEHAPDDEVLQRRDAVRVDAVDLGAGHRQALGQHGRRQPRVDVVRHPEQGQPHPNCSRSRRSFSKNIRRSGTPCLRKAIRSIPIPQAKPWWRSAS